MAVTDWSTTAGSNTTLGALSTQGTAQANTIDDLFRELMAQIATQFGKANYKGADLASASTTDLSTATGNYVHITGTTTVTALGTVAAGQVYILEFDAALTLTHNGTSLILPDATSIKTEAGAIAIMVSEGAGNWRCIQYMPPYRPGSLFKRTFVTSSGTHTFDVRTRFAFVEVIGAGGGGGSGQAGGAAKAASGSGGGAGGYANKFFSTTGIASGTVTIGAAGAASANTAGATGGNGGNSSWSDGTNTLTANGGGGGGSTSGITTINSISGGSGGTASGGDVNTQGQAGDWCLTESINILAGGAAGLGRAGKGASGPYGAGGDAPGAASSTSGGSNSPGSAGTGYGSGGGGGGGVNSSSSAAGGAGTQGLVVVWEYR